jgi:hypothetical protein
MKNRILTLLAGLVLIIQTSRSQSIYHTDFRHLPIVISIQFHSLAMPFRDLKSNYRNIGVGLGTEIYLNNSYNWVQQLNVIWFRNRSAGNGLLFNTQVAWRPYLSSYSIGELQAGLGYQISFRPTESYVEKKGQWTSAGKKGKGMFAVLMGVSLGPDFYFEEAYLSTFVSYQSVFLLNYSKSVPVMSETLVQMGFGIHPFEFKYYE